MGYPRVPMASLWRNGGNKTIWGNIQAKKKYFFKKIPYVIPSALLSFLPYYCHSFRIIVIPSVLVSFLPNIVIPSELFRELQILTSSKSFPYPKGVKNGHQRWPYMRVLLKCTWARLFICQWMERHVNLFWHCGKEVKVYSSLDVFYFDMIKSDKIIVS